MTSHVPSVIEIETRQMPVQKTITKKTGNTTKTTVKTKPTYREHKENLARLELQKAKVNKAADTVKSIGVQVASTARNAGASVVASQALTKAEAEAAAKSFNQYGREESLTKYYEAIQGSPEAEGKAQAGSTTGTTPSTSGMD